MTIDPTSVLAHNIKGTLAGMLGMGLTVQNRLPQMGEARTGTGTRVNASASRSGTP
jgi:hypothetical protein